MESNIGTEKHDWYEHNCEAYFKKCFGSVIKEGEDNEIMKKVTFLKDNIMIKKIELNKQINEETQNLKERMKHLKIHTDDIVKELFDMDIINKKKQKKKNMNRSGKKDDKNERFEKIYNMDDDNVKKENKMDKGCLHFPFPSSDSLIKNDDNKYIEDNNNIDKLYENMNDKIKDETYNSSDVCSEDEYFEEEELHNMNFENLLKKCIEEKKRLENIKRGLTFLKCYPMIKNEINELFLTSYNIKLNIEEKIKNIKLLHKHLIYINENEDIINYIKTSCSHDISLYTNKFFNDFFFIINDILSIYIIENTHIPNNGILKIFVDLYDIYLSFLSKKTTNYTSEFLINELIKKMVHFIILNFTKTFLKFVQSDEHILLYNAIINYYEYFITFIDERSDTMQNIIVNIIYVVYNMEQNKLRTQHGFDVKKEKKIINNNKRNDNYNNYNNYHDEDKSVVVRETGEIFNDVNLYNLTFEQQKMDDDKNKNTQTYKYGNKDMDNKENSKVYKYYLYDGNDDDNNMKPECDSNLTTLQKNYKNNKYGCSQDIRDNYVDFFYINLFVESIHVICNYIEDSEIIMNIINESSNMNEKNILYQNVDENIINDKNINYKKTTKKNFIHNIMESLKVSLQTLCNSSFFISKKKIFNNVLKECSFINKCIVDEYLISIINYVSFDLNVFVNINLKVNHFDRTNFISENKLFLFFSEIQNDIKNIIEKKCNELNNKDIFHSYFFSFVLYFSFIYKHDTEFLLLYINMYNILYEIIYNIKEEIKTKKKSKQPNSGDHNNDNNNYDNMNYLSIQMKEDFYKSNEVCEYVKNIITIFLKSLNIFNNIINDYESFGAYLFEKTYATYKSKNVFNIISKCMIEKNDHIFNYPHKIDKNICQIHQYFFKHTFPKKNLNEQENKNMNEEENKRMNEQENKRMNEQENKSMNEQENKSMNEQENKSMNDQGEQRNDYVKNDDEIIDGEDNNQTYSQHSTDNHTNKNKGHKNDNISSNKNITDIFSDLSLNIEDIDTHECGKQLLKSSLCKLNEIKNTILKNIIHFTLIPIYDYINKYINSFITYYKNNQVKDIKENIKNNNIDIHERGNHKEPNEYICFIVDTIFIYMEILYEHKCEDLLEQLLLLFEENYVLSIHNLKDINTHILLQIQTDLQYLINIYKKFENKNYKHFLILYISISFSLTNTDVTNLQISFEKYINDYIRIEYNSTLLNFNINNDDILKATSYVKQLIT
ncbi:hypothetical protein PFFVO_02428 [Plasmodium falciparum Vietnam Oak-Knoll (FVO)]|uniref:Uncharacterized protein n=1 Tax=Plasmodium falciparum Vietnam Oak-Knoll (FVO) TaxID=1036723 RepID=A0A024V7S0_PLAFA|nr:hypothetical protein PFFVO_02428 [Plasmodium falciparum Vietnam Oak-Knoll (FVO)]